VARPVDSATRRPYDPFMGITFGSLVDDDGWFPMFGAVSGQVDFETGEHRRIDASNATFHWSDGGSLANAPVDMPATFADGMFLTSKPIDVPGFNRNPLRVRPHFRVPRHHHNLPEMILVFRGTYIIGYEEDGKEVARTVGPGEYFISRPGTPYTMTAGPEGVTYIETWPVPASHLHTWWYDWGWIDRAGWPGGD
jgi:hypothetical protein